MTPNESQPNIFAIYKPKGLSSNQALNRLRKMFDTKKVGHAGTLDPLAEGVLVVGVGREATKQLDSVVQKEKEYLAEITFGHTSTTDDGEGEKTLVSDVPVLKEAIKAALPQFIGTIQQAPPQYSAIKVRGREAYKYASAGQELALSTRTVEIKEIEIISYAWPLLKLRVVTGSGVYIRSLARELGEHMNCGAYLSGLVRTRVGEYTLAQAHRLEETPQNN